MHACRHPVQVHRRAPLSRPVTSTGGRPQRIIIVSVGPSDRHSRIRSSISRRNVQPLPACSPHPRRVPTGLRLRLGSSCSSPAGLRRRRLPRSSSQARCDHFRARRLSCQAISTVCCAAVIRSPPATSAAVATGRWSPDLQRAAVSYSAQNCHH